MPLRDEIELAVRFHSDWKARLRRAIEHETLPDGGGFALTAIRADHRCRFGKWLYGPTISAQERSSPGFARVREIHLDFHLVAAEVLMLAATGNPPAAMAALDGRYHELSGNLVDALRHWQGLL
jgi:hypothetical protein